MRTLFVALILLPLSALARITTDDFAAVASRIRELGAKHKPSRVLVVYDFDNTLLAMNQDLGSDQWFNWQSGLLAKPGEKGDPAAVAPDFPGLLRVQGVLYNLSGMRPTDPSIPAQVTRLQAEGFPSMILSSRSSDFRDATERELARHGLDFSNTGVPPQSGYPGSYLPYRLSDPKRDGLTEEEVRKWKLTEARPVSYTNGIFLGAGQHKGAMLRALLARADRKYPALVFVDDTERHCIAVEEAFAGRGVDLVTVRFSREDPKVRAFERESKQGVIRDWRRLSDTLKIVFGPRSAVAPGASPAGTPPPAAAAGAKKR